MPRRLSEKQKKIIIDNFKDGKTIEDLSKEFNCTNLTIVRNIKKNLGEKIYKDLVNKRKNLENFKSSSDKKNMKNDDPEYTSPKLTNVIKESSNLNENDSESYQSPFAEFIEISPLNYEIENSPRKDLSSVSIADTELPKIVYMIVDKNIELEIKLLKEFPEWEFLPTEDLERKTIEIYSDLKIAKRFCKREQRVIKVPNTDVFRIASPILVSKGITRIINEDRLIAL